MPLTFSLIREIRKHGGHVYHTNGFGPNPIRYYIRGSIIGVETGAFPLPPALMALTPSIYALVWTNKKNKTDLVLLKAFGINPRDLLFTCN